eukprot:sb/3465768/
MGRNQHRISTSETESKSNDLNEYLECSLFTNSPDRSSIECSSSSNTSSAEEDSASSDESYNVGDRKHDQRRRSDENKVRDEEHQRSLQNQREHPQTRRLQRPSQSSENYRILDVTQDELELEQTLKEEKELERRKAAWVYHSLSNSRLTTSTSRTKSFISSEEKEKRKAAWVYHSLSNSRLTTSTSRTKSFRSTEEKEKRKAAWVFHNLSCSRLNTTAGRAKSFRSSEEKERRKAAWVFHNLSSSRLSTSAHRPKRSTKSAQRSERTDRILNSSLDEESPRRREEVWDKKERRKQIRKDNPEHLPRKRGNTNKQTKSTHSEDHANYLYQQKQSRPKVINYYDSDSLPVYDLEPSTSHSTFNRNSKRKQSSHRR